MGRSLAATIRAANSELLEIGNLDLVSAYFTEDYVVHATSRDIKRGQAFVRSLVSELRLAFPGLKVEVQILVEGGGRIAWQRTVSGRHRSAFKGFPATGRRLVWRDMVVSEIRDGRVAEDWVISDLAERLLASRAPNSRRGASVLAVA